MVAQMRGCRGSDGLDPTQPWIIVEHLGPAINSAPHLIDRDGRFAGRLAAITDPGSIGLDTLIDVLECACLSSSDDSGADNWDTQHDRFLLDTNVLSELRKGRNVPPATLAVEWASNVDEGALFISAITILELEIGVRLRERKDKPQGAVLRRWLDEIVRPTFAGRILPVDEDVALCCAAFHVPDPAAERNALIAATAQCHGLTIVTRNVDDFVRTGVPILNPWAQ